MGDPRRPSGRPRGGRGADGLHGAAALNAPSLHYLITGCSGAGKSSVIDELARRGHAVVREPGRRLIARGITPWSDIGRFLDAAEAMAWDDLAQAPACGGPVFFDRGVLDAIAGIERLTGETIETRLAGRRPYAPQVLFAGEWPAIFAKDADRRHSLGDASSEAGHLRLRLPGLGYQLHELPQTSIAERADFALALAEASGELR